jgi:crotonobetainyl-CoA:carnitine CoA-transferase CaiB-like acyl-CoA transferase
MGPFRDGESYCFAQVNRNKRGVALDLKHPGGLKALLALAARSDVLDTTEHWVTAMLTAGVPAGPVNTYDQMIADPHLTARGVTTTVEDVGALQAAGAAYDPALSGERP